MTPLEEAVLRVRRHRQAALDEYREKGSQAARDFVSRCNLVLALATPGITWGFNDDDLGDA